jgi:glycosyltransferase involved in cell wall biosynthesis
MKNKPITLLFDVSPLANSKKSGVGYYTERLLVALASRYPDDLQIIGHYFNFLSKKDVSLPEHPNIHYRQTTLFPSKLINIFRRVGIELPLELFLRKKGDFIIYPNFVGFRSLRKIPSSVAVHDLGYLDCPEYLQAGNRTFLTRYVPKSIRRSNLVITISEATKSAIQRHYGTADSKFVITPIPPPKTDITPEKPSNINGKFILFVSTLEPRKNFIGLVRGYMQLPAEARHEYSLVLAGGPGWNVQSELAEITKLQEQGENIITTGYISEQEKAWLLQNATLFVLPSHYEGFGMPILEAMAVGTPTAVSDIPVFHEVSGDASIYFKKDDPQAIANSLQDILASPELQNKLSDLGHAQVDKLDWNTIAESLFERIRSEISNKT